MRKFIAILVTCPDKKSAHKLAKILLQKKLAACVNVVAGMESFYWWQGKIERSRETLLVIKSAQKLFKPLCRCVQENHSYTVPEIIALPIVQGSSSYLRWLKENLTSGE